MADVVKIAKKCHAELTAEIARLDEFIRMAERLLKYEREGSKNALHADQDVAAEPAGPIPASAISAPARTNGAQAKA
jgi:hypothetical protein